MSTFPILSPDAHRDQVIIPYLRARIEYDEARAIESYTLQLANWKVNRSFREANGIAEPPPSPPVKYELYIALDGKVLTRPTGFPLVPEHKETLKAEDFGFGQVLPNGQWTVSPYDNSPSGTVKQGPDGKLYIRHQQGERGVIGFVARWIPV